MTQSIKDLTDEEFIEAVKAKYNYHLNLSLKLKLMLDAYDGKFTNAENVSKGKKTDTPQETLFHKTSIQEKPIKEKRSKATFESIVLDILSDGQPRLVSELIEDYSKKTGKTLKTKDFSSKLSIRAKSGNKIRNVKFNDFPIEKRFWWCLTDWFDGNLLKPEYAIKIHDKYKRM